MPGPILGGCLISTVCLVAARVIKGWFCAKNPSFEVKSLTTILESASRHSLDRFYQRPVNTNGAQKKGCSRFRIMASCASLSALDGSFDDRKRS
jgi:hypothetical protein